MGTKIKNNQKKATIICFVSGKGGAGKTSICISLGKILDSLNKKILLIDLDISTHGMTYFFKEKMGNVKNGLIELLNNSKLGANLIKLNDNFHILPSTSKLIDKKIIMPRIFKNFSDVIINKYSLQYDYILLDCQAGVNKSSQSAIKNSNIAIYVSEADPFSAWAIKNIEYKFYKTQPKKTYGLINKLFLEEKQRYDSFVKFSKMINHLPPLPFDSEVRNRIFKGLIPVNFEKPSSFLITLLYLTKELLPELEKKINDRLIKSKSHNRENISKKIADIDNKIKETLNKKAIIRSKNKFSYDYLLSLMLSVVFILSLGIGYVFILKDAFDFSISSNLIFAFIFITFGIIIQISLWSIRTRRKRIIEATTEEYLLQHELDELYEKKKNFELIISEAEEKKYFL